MEQLTADQLMEILIQVQHEGHDLRKIVINFRTNADYDVQPCACIAWDLFDEETNSKLRSLVLMTEPTDY